MRFRDASIALLCVLVACGRPAPTPPAASSASSASVATPVASHAPLRAGTSGDYPPLSIWKNDRVEGFAPALVAAFASAEKTELGWTRFRWPGLAEDLRADRFDLAADGITVRPERSIGGRFSVPIARGGAVLLVRRRSASSPSTGSTGPAQDPLAQLAAIDRPDLHVLVNQGGHLERVARSLLHAADIRAIADNDAVRAAFARGEADAAMTNTFEAPRWAAEAPGVEQLGPLTQDVTAIWLRADRGELGDRLDTWLLDEEESGRLAALRSRWLGPDAGVRAASPVSALLAATEERLALMPFVAAAKQRAGKAVEDVGQEERVLAASADAVTKAAALRGVTPPRRDHVDAFFRAQIEAAKAVQRRAAPGSTTAIFSLDDDLRPAIARISARMATLVVRVPRGAQRAAVLTEARVDLASTGLDAEQIEGLASAIAGLGADR
ncbi:MAG: Cyclohexadienyl dehydratase [Myxococcaceae bacterium]|nr:Cyclohexadienyl dehydratase [Myxococcaceae bacterium]